MIKTAIIGASGYIGQHLLNSYRESFPDCIGTSYKNSQLNLVPFDIRNPNIDTLNLVNTEYKAVIICAAKPNIEYCEYNKNSAYEVNVKGTLELIRQLGKTSLQVIFLSSDYVFDGIKGNYNDYDETKPITEYGKQKSFVENEIPSLTDNFLIIRLSKIYGTSKFDGTLLDEITRLLINKSKVLAAYDQIFSPTYINDIVKAIHAIQQKKLSGLMNLCNPNSWSRYDIAITISNEIGIDNKYVEKISLSDLPFKTKRPCNTSMRCDRFLEEIKMPFTSLNSCIKQVGTNWRTDLND